MQHWILSHLISKGVQQTINMLTATERIEYEQQRRSAAPAQKQVSPLTEELKSIELLIDSTIKRAIDETLGAYQRHECNITMMNTQYKLFKKYLCKLYIQQGYAFSSPLKRGHLDTVICSW